MQRCGEEKHYRQVQREELVSETFSKEGQKEHKAAEMQGAAVGDSRMLYKITRELTGSWKTQPTVLRDKEGNIISKLQMG